MQLLRKNDDLVSQIESHAGMGNELGELEYFEMNNIPGTTKNARGSINLLQVDVDDLEPDNEDQEYMDDATLDAERGRKNSLMMMENDFQFQNNFEDNQFQENAEDYVDIDNFDGVNLADNLQEEVTQPVQFQINSPTKEFVD